MAKVKFFIRTSNKKTSSNIRIRFTHGRTFDLFANSQKEIIPIYWNNSKGEVRHRIEFIDSEEFQKNLDLLSSYIIKEFNTISNKDKIDRNWLINTIDKFYCPEKYIQTDTFFGFIQDFLKNSDKRINTNTGNPVSYKMKREYAVTYRYLEEYAKKYKEPNFVDIDLEFYQNFVDLLRNKGLANNTIGKKIQTLKIFLNDAFEKGINPYTKYKSKRFKVLSEESDNIYLTKEEINKLYTYDFSDKPRLEKVRDLFIIGCWTGLRFSDLEQITTDKIKGDFIKLKQKKTGNPVDIPIHPTVKELLNKYKGVLPKAISNQKYNDYLKEAAKIAGINELFFKTISHKGKKVEKKYFKYELISSHTARRSFCTNAYKDNIPTMAIMAVSGHKTEKAFLKYIKADSKVHAQKVLDAWKSQQSYLKVAN